jgi:CRISPR/Cas system endoribonuclease Cas6 (RAMP superfamily)
VERAKTVKTVAKDLRWVEWERYSGRQDTTMLMGGFVGSARFQGDLGEFVPLLRLGELVHVGKGTVFGLGLFDLRRGGSASRDEFDIQD